MSAPGLSAAEIKATYARAMAAQKAGRLDEAAGLYRRILGARTLPEPMFQLGRIAHAAGKDRVAAEWFRRALELKPKEGAIWRALIAATTGKARAEAIAGARRAGLTIEVGPGEMLDAADELIAAGKIAEGRRRYRKAIEKGLAPVPTLTRLGARLDRARRPKEAMAAFDEALRLDPRHVEARSARAQLLLTLGKVDEGVAALRALVADAPGATRAWVALMRAQKQPPGSPDVAALEARIAASRDEEEIRILSFALAKACEDQGRDGEVFRHLDRGNALTHARWPYSFRADYDQARGALRRWSAAEGGYEGAAPIFVTGLPRSGTTLVESILAAHPDITAGGELSLFGPHVYGAIDAHGRGEAVDWAEVGRRWARAAAAKAGPGRVTDKSISTFSILGYVANALPRARFVVLDRDRRDVGLSIYKNKFEDGRHRYSTDMEALGRYIRLFDACVAGWEARLPERIHRLDYDALTADPEPHVRALLAFCALPWDPACLTPERAERHISTLSVVQARQPINRGSVGAWRRFEADLAPLTRALEANRFDLDDTDASPPA